MPSSGPDSVGPCAAHSRSPQLSYVHLLVVGVAQGRYRKSGRVEGKLPGGGGARGWYLKAGLGAPCQPGDK